MVIGLLCVPGSHSYYVDVVIVVSVLVTFTCCWLSYQSQHSTRSQTERLMKDLASLQSAEDSLKTLQKQYVHTAYMFIYIHAVHIRWPN